MTKPEPPPEDTGKDSEKKDASKEEEPDELSKEDQLLKDTLEGYVKQLSEPNNETIKSAITNMGKEIREATTSMTSVPKPLKFLRPHYATVKAAYDSVPQTCKSELAQVISVLATVSCEEGEHDALDFCLKAPGTDPGTWGHEYMSHLAGEIAAEHSKRLSADPPASVDDLMTLVTTIVPHHMKHNSEPEAVDLLLEVDEIDLLLEHVDESNYQRTCLYLATTAAYLPEPDDAAVFTAAYNGYMKVCKWHDAMRIALRLNDHNKIVEAFAKCDDKVDKQQLAYLLARQGVVLDCEDGPCAIEDEDERSAVVDIMYNTQLSERFLALARDLDVMEAKEPDDVYKMHLVDTHRSGVPNPSMESGMKNLSKSIVNALLNVGFGVDKMVTAEEKEGEKTWVSRNKDHGKISAVASIGAINMWNPDAGLPVVDRYTYSEDPNIMAGACLGIGLCCCCIRSELDPAFALLVEHVSSETPVVQQAAIMALGLAYAGTEKEDVQESLLPLIDADSSSIEVAAHASLALGLVFAGTPNEEIAQTILAYLMSLPEEKLTTAFVKFVLLGLGFLFLGKQEIVEPTLEVARSLNERIAKLATTMLDTCAYAGSGNVLKVQEMLAMCGDHIDAEEGSEWKKAHLGAATLGVGLIAMGEELGTAMATRMLEHLLSYADADVRAAVPLTLALLRPSEPDMSTMDTLSRLSHDMDNNVARGALLGLGVIGAGTNNARLAGVLPTIAKVVHALP